MAIDVTCPKCKQRTVLSEEFEGGDFSCPGCGFTVSISGEKVAVYKEAADTMREPIWPEVVGILSLAIIVAVAIAVFIWLR